MRTAKEITNEYVGDMLTVNGLSSSLFIRAINAARKEALEEAANKCGIGLPTMWAVQDEIKKLIRDLK